VRDFWKSCGHHMTERCGDSISRIGRLGSSLQSKKSRHHELNLLLRRAARSHNRFFYFRRRILEDLNSRLLAREKNHSARVPEDNRRANVSRVKHILDGHRIRAVALDELEDSGVNLLH